MTNQETPGTQQLREGALAKGALDGIKILDLTRVLAGPWATQILGDLGAEIVKVERPGSGDETRAWGPPNLKTEDGSESDRAAYFASANRNKRSLAIDMARPEGAELLRRLAAESDVVIENFKVGGLKRYGLDYESLSAINPRLVYCSITGFGQVGPYAPRAGYDFVIQAMCGLMSVTGDPSNHPQKVGVALTDVMTGLYAVIGVLSALRARDVTGRGQHLDLSLLDVGVATMANQAMNYLATGKPPGQIGNAHPNIVPYQTFETADGHVVIAVGNDGQFARLCEILGLPELASDPRFASNGQRVTHREILVPLLQEKMLTRGTQDWVATLESHAVPCGPVNTLAGVFADPHVQARGMAIAVEDPRLGKLPGVASPLKLSDTPPSYRSAPPALGQHTREILAERLGLNDTEIAALLEKSVVAQG